MILLKRIAIGLVGVVLVAFVLFALFKDKIAQRAFDRAIAQNAGVDRSAALPDGLHVYMCGTGSPMPDATRAGPCLGVLAGDRAFVFDVGAGGTRNLGSMGFPIGRLEGVYLTHLHSDHLDGLGELMLLSWIGGSRTSPTPISGPGGTQQVVAGFNMAYQIDSTYRIAHHGVEVANPGGYGGTASEIEIPAGGDGQLVVLEDGDLKITAIRVQHAPIDPAFGYRIDYKDRSISISGDTIYHEGFISASTGVDLMFHEALDAEMVTKIGSALGERGQTNAATIFSDILDYHTDPEDAARAAQKAGAEHLVLYHIVPQLPVKMLESVFLGDAASFFDGPITVGQDGLLFSLPSGSDDIGRTNAF